jgi:hypothetical protein
VPTWAHFPSGPQVLFQNREIHRYAHRADLSPSSWIAALIACSEIYAALKKSSLN